MGRMTSHILWKLKNVPNHQPAMKMDEFGVPPFQETSTYPETPR
jgi:hypothetical protein